MPTVPCMNKYNHVDTRRMIHQRKIQGLVIAAVFGVSLMPFTMSTPKASAAGDDARIDCTVVGDSLVDCGGGLYSGPTMIITYDPPFSEKHGGCGGEAVDLHPDVGVFTFVVRNSWGGCPHQIGDRVTFTHDPPFFVTPESPIGDIAMLVASMGALGGFYLRMAKKPVSVS